MRTHRFRTPRIIAVAILVAAMFGWLSVSPAAADTLTVTSSADSGDGSLRDVIDDASSGDTIVFNLPGGAPWTITLGSSINFSKSLTIDGPGAAADLTISGGDADNIFGISSGPTTIRDLTLANGFSDTALVGAAISSSGNLALTNVTVKDNDGIGGAVSAFGGTLVINDSTISNNEGSGVSAFNTSTTITGTEVNGHTEEGIGASGTSQLSVINSFIHNNDGGDGGGISFGSSGTLIVTDSRIVDNDAVEGGGIHVEGSMTLTNSVVSGNTADSAGGLYVGGVANISGSTITDNEATAGSGGGIECSATLNLTDTSVTANTASSGGGAISCFSGSISLTNSLVAGNTATNSGTHGIDYSSTFGSSIPTTINLTNVTLSGNGPGALPTGGSATGAVLNIFVSGALANIAVTLTNVTVVGNNGGTGMLAFATASGATVTMAVQNSIFAVNGTPNFASAGITSGGRNISDDTSGNAILTGPNDQNDTDPLLAAAGLADNGGAVETIALQATSPAIDRIPASGANCPATDARGFTRPSGAGCDSGAFEVGATAPPSPSPSPSADPSANPSPSPACVSGFADVPSNHPACATIKALTTQGIIRGYNTNPPTFGPDDDVQRAQVAAFLVRALLWQGEATGPKAFTDFGGLVGELQSASLILANQCDNTGRCVARGYEPAACTARGLTFPCFGPNDQVSYAQVISFIARAFQFDATYAWVPQPSAAHPYSGVPTIHEQDVRTFHAYAGTIPAAPTSSADWSKPAPREWIAMVLYQALISTP